MKRFDNQVPKGDKKVPNMPKSIKQFKKNLKCKKDSKMTKSTRIHNNSVLSRKINK